MFAGSADDDAAQLALNGTRIAQIEASLQALQV